MWRLAPGGARAGGDLIARRRRVDAARGRVKLRAASCTSLIRTLILNLMVQYETPRLDASFAALSDATRRGVLEQLGRSDASITELADRFHMTLTGMRKHVGVLEHAGFVTTEKVGRVRTCRLGLRRLEEEAAWIERYRQLWAARFDALDAVVEDLKRKEKIDD
jgi:DNA-binding transcriptional ArsR family regulator